MRILFDQGTPIPLRDHLTGHVIETAFELGWSTLENGELLAAAENSFDLLITTDQNLRYQQNLAGRDLGILVLMTTSWPRIQKSIPQILDAIARLSPGELFEITPPR
jgi:predicted nuclease of predicted toxin-antitoxin system